MYVNCAINASSWTFDMFKNFKFTRFWEISKKSRFIRLRETSKKKSFFAHIKHFDFVLNKRLIQHQKSSKTRYSKVSTRERFDFDVVARKTSRLENQNLHFKNEQEITLKMLSMKYLLMIRVYEWVANLKCLTSRDFCNLDRRSFRIIYKMKWIFVVYNFLTQSSIVLDIFEMNLF